MRLPTSYRSQLGPAADFLLDKDWLETAYKGRGARAIATEIGCGKKAVLSALRRHNIEVGKSGANRTNTSHAVFARSVPPAAVGKLDNKDWMFEYYINKNWTAKRIGGLLGVSWHCVQTWARRHNLRKTRKAKNAAINYGYKESTGHDIGSDWACRRRMEGHRRERYNSCKAGTIVCHSSWEKIVAEFLDQSDLVLSFTKDVLRIPYVFRGKFRIYYPDFLVHLKKRQLIIEVKALKLVTESRTKAKLSALSRFGRRMGFDYLVLSGQNNLDIWPLKQYLETV